MATFGNIKGHESTYAANNFKARSVKQNINSTDMHQEVVTLGGTESSLAVGAVLDSAPASTAWGLVVRPIGDSTVVTVAALPANSSKVEVTALPANSSKVEVTAFPANSSKVEISAFPASYVIASDSAVRVTVVGGGSTQVSIGGVNQTMQVAASSNAFAASTLYAINSTVTGQKCKVYAYSITTTNAGPKTLCFYAGTDMKWPVQLAAVSSAISGANLAVTPPGFLFETAAGSSMTLRCSGSTATGFKVGVAFFVAP